tara:strand:+ start:1216 stop:1737 length:522 start_codon:yes stop_codon:yes gene_type:complete
MEKYIQIPGKINFYNFAKKEVSLNGNYKISELSRLSEISSNKNDKVEVDLNFHLENGKIPCVEGIIKLKLVLDCQRCLDNLEVDLKVTFGIAFTRNESQTDSLNDKFEIYLIEEEELDAKNLITDEILLAIPMAPSHDFDCGLKTDKGDIVEEIRKHPFDALKKIKIANFGKE